MGSHMFESGLKNSMTPDLLESGFETPVFWVLILKLFGH